MVYSICSEVFCGLVTALSLSVSKNAAFWFVQESVFYVSDLFFPMFLQLLVSVGLAACLLFGSVFASYWNKSVVWFNGLVASETELL